MIKARTIIAWIYLNISLLCSTIQDKNGSRNQSTRNHKSFLIMDSLQYKQNALFGGQVCPSVCDQVEGLTLGQICLKFNTHNYPQKLMNNSGF
jgi:hypothetical protein